MNITGKSNLIPNSLLWIRSITQYALNFFSSYSPSPDWIGSLNFEKWNRLQPCTQAAKSIIEEMHFLALDTDPVDPAAEMLTIQAGGDFRGVGALGNILVCTLFLMLLLSPT